MAGVYIHFPFCKQKCHYCNFFSVASLKSKDRLLQSLLQEIDLQKHFLDGEIIDTIYFGGGTPSLLNLNEIILIIDKLTKLFPVQQGTEITLEANPDDLNLVWLKELKKTFVNRLSIGVQSFYDDDLRYLNRIHSADDALISVKNAINTGFSNLSIDLIYGIPTLTEENWIRNLETFFSLNIPHLSAYALTVESRTALDILISKNKMKPVKEETMIGHFKQLVIAMKEYGYSHYEISNFCQQEYFSRHNMSYWSGKKYLGLGPSAHSYNGISRQWNVSKISEYIQAIANQKIPAEMERLTDSQRYNEYILTSLRTMWGTNPDYITSKFGLNLSEYFLKKIKIFIDNKKVVYQHGAYCLTNEGMLFADGISSELFV